MPAVCPRPASARWRVFAAGTLVALLAACGSAPPRPTEPAQPTRPADRRQPELAAFRAQLSPRETVPPAASNAQGELVAVLNRNTGLLRWKLNFSELSGPVRGASFHSPGMAGEVAPAVLSVGRNVVSPYEGRAMLTPGQRADLLAGQWYVNLRTAAHPEGELRGQLLEQR